MVDAQIEKVFREIGKRIAKQRQAQGISRDKLAYESGLDRSHVDYKGSV